MRHAALCRSAATKASLTHLLDVIDQQHRRSEALAAKVGSAAPPDVQVELQSAQDAAAAGKREADAQRALARTLAEALQHLEGPALEGCKGHNQPDQRPC